MKSLVYGVGINDADYVVIISDSYYVDGVRRRKLVWQCPYYKKWSSMLFRCYSKKHHDRQPTYRDCIVAEEWLTFSNFKSWMEKQDWEGKELDKDILVPGNNVYSPETCVFVDKSLNNFLTDRTNDRGDWPIGVCFDKSAGKFMASCSNPLTKKREYLGIFTCPQEAHLAWKKRKQAHAFQLADLQTDERVANALKVRYL